MSEWNESRNLISAMLGEEAWFCEPTAGFILGSVRYEGMLFQVRHRPAEDIWQLEIRGATPTAPGAFIEASYKVLELTVGMWKKYAAAA